MADDNLHIAASADASVANANSPNISAMHQLALMAPQLRFSASTNLGHHWVLSTTLALVLAVILADAKVANAKLYIVLVSALGGSGTQIFQA